MADDNPLMLSILNRIEDKVDEAKIAAVLAAQRAELLDKKIDDHLKADKEIHDAQSGAIGGLNTWRTELKTKIATYAAIASVIFGAAVTMGKAALAAVLQSHP